MGMKYRILDYKNGRIISNIGSTKEVCSMLLAVAMYSNSFDVVTHNNEFITGDFYEELEGDVTTNWIYSPQAREAKG